MKSRAVTYAKRLFGQFQDDDVMGIGAELAYRFLFAVFPFGIFLAGLGGFIAEWAGVDDPTQLLMGAVRDNLPAEISGEVALQLDQVVGTTQPGLLSFGAVAAIWAATGGTSSLMKAMNRAYDVEESRGFVKKTAVAIALTVVGGAGILVSFVTIVGGSAVTQELGERLGVGDVALTVITLARWPAILLLLGLAVGALFRYAPDVRVSWRYTILGGLLFAVVWLLATAAFGFYVANFGNYANTYGALGGVIALMLWFYLTGVVLVTAAELVAVIATEREPHLVATKANPKNAGTVDARPGTVTPPLQPIPPAPAPRVMRGAAAWETGYRAQRERGNPVLAAAILGGGALIGALIGRLSSSGAEDDA